MRIICAKRSPLSSCRSSERFRSVRSYPGRRDISDCKQTRSAASLIEWSSRNSAKDTLIYRPSLLWSSQLKVIHQYRMHRAKGSELDWREMKRSTFITRQILNICGTTVSNWSSFHQCTTQSCHPVFMGLSLEEVSRNYSLMNSLRIRKSGQKSIR